MISGRVEFIANRKDFDFAVSLYELTPAGEYVQLAPYWARASYARDLTKRQLLEPGRRETLDFRSIRLMSRRLAAGSRLVLVLQVIKETGRQINYGTGEDVNGSALPAPPPLAPLPPPMPFFPSRRQAPMPDKPILSGDLSRIQLPDVLSFVAMIRESGKLVVRRAELERTILWKEGEIVFATSSSPEHSLGQFLLRNGKITQEQYEESKRRVTPQLRHGKLLVQMGAISPKDLWWGVKNQTLEIIYGLFSWKEGEFSFYESAEELSHERIVLHINTSSVIMEGIRRLDESARIREKIPNLDVVFAKVSGAAPDFRELDMSETEIALFNDIDGYSNVRELTGRSDLTEFEVTRILFQLLSARLIEQVKEEEKSFRPVFLDVEDSPELLKIISTYNDMFGRLFETLERSVGDEQARDIFMTVLQNAETDELWAGVFFDQYGRFDENMLIANISELPFEKRKSVLDEGLNTLLSVQLFEVSQHLDQAGKVDVFRFISDQKASLEKAAV